MVKYLLIFMLLASNSYASETRNDDVARGLASQVIFGSIFAAMIYSSGKRPERTRNIWLSGAAISAMFIDEPIKYCLAGTTLAMSAINQYYFEHPEKSESEAGTANLIGAALGAASPKLFKGCIQEGSENHKGISFYPDVKVDEISFRLEYRF